MLMPDFMDWLGSSWIQLLVFYIYTFLLIGFFVYLSCTFYFNTIAFTSQLSNTLSFSLL